MRAIPCSPQIGEAARDPIRVLLDRGHHVGEHRWAARARDQEQVGEARRADAEIGARPLGPLLAQRAAAGAADVDREQRTGHRVEAGGEHDRVDLVLHAGDAHAPRRDRFDRGLRDVDQRDVRPIERRVVAGIHAQALAADHLLGRELRRERRIPHYLADLRAHELGGGLVRLVIEEQVAERGDEPESADPPPLFVDPVALGGVDLVGQHRVRREVGAERLRGIALAEARVVRLHLAHELGIERGVVRGDREARACAGRR